MLQVHLTRRVYCSVNIIISKKHFLVSLERQFHYLRTQPSRFVHEGTVSLKCEHIFLVLHRLCCPEFIIYNYNRTYLSLWYCHTDIYLPNLNNNKSIFSISSSRFSYYSDHTRLFSYTKIPLIRRFNIQQLIA